MSSPTVQEFWSDSHHGNPFGVMGPLYGPHGHLGDDTNGWAEGTIIPSYIAGPVVMSGWSPTLGWCVIIHALAIDRYVSFCHMHAQGIKVGNTVDIGTGIGPIGQSGSLAAGVHVHTAVAASAVLGGYDVEDPRPFIVAARSGTIPAGNGSISLNTEDDMYDEAAEARLMDAIKKAGSPFKEYQVGGGIVLVNPQTGKGWGIPSQAYADLLRALGLSAGPVRQSAQNEIDFMGFIGGVIGESQPVPLALSADDVAKITAALPTPQIVLSQGQLDAIEAAAKKGGADAISSLSFVTVATAKS